MKREHHHLHPPSNPELCSSVAGGGGGNCGAGASSSSASVAAKAKAKAWEDEIQNDSGMDELLAVLGYEVRSSKMAEVAQKLEQLEEVMGKAAAVTEDGFSQLASDTVHYNPSDLSNWLENMLSELNPPNFDPLSAAAAAASAAAAPPFTPAESSTITSSHYHLFDDSSTDDLKVIPGRAIYSSNSTTSSDPCSRENKRFKFSSPPWAAVAPMAETMPPQSSIARPVVLVDSVEDGVRLVHSLTACADAVQQDNLKLAEMLVKQISILAASQAGAMGKVATFFAEALTLKIYRLSPPLDSLLNDDDLQMSFYDASPYLKFAHFTANQAILEAFAGKSRLHVIDFGMKQGQQWPALMQALALRPGGAPSLRITGIGPPPPDGADRLQDVGWKLAQFAKSVNVKFEYRGLVAASLADLSAAALDLRPGEAVAVNSVFELHRLLAVPGATERLLAAVREMRPEIFTVVEQEANHNSAVFLDRFMESLHYYSTMFDSLEGGGGGGCGGAVSDEDRVMAEVYLGRQICNVVACDGAERVERHEPLGQWRGRMERAGFAPAHLGSNAFRQASTLLEVFAGGEGYRVEENGGCLTLGWHTRPLIATSAWQIAGGRRQNALLS